MWGVKLTQSSHVMVQTPRGCQMGQLLSFASPEPPCCRSAVPPADGSDTLMRLPDVLFPLILQFVPDAKLVLLFARAHRRLLKAASTAHAWDSTPLLTVTRIDRLPPLSSALGQRIPVRFEAPPQPGVWMSELEVRALLAFAGRAQLMGLDLSHPGCKQPPLAQLLPLLDHPRFRSLQQLTLGLPDHPIAAANVMLDRALLLSLSRMPHLRSLYFPTSKISDVSLWKLLPTFPALQEFRLGERCTDLVALMNALAECAHLTSVGFCGPSACIAEMYRLSIAANAANIRSLGLEKLEYTGESDPYSDPIQPFYREAFQAMTSLSLLTLRDCIDPCDLLQFVHHCPSLSHVIIEPRYNRDDLESSLAKMDWILQVLPNVMARMMQLRVTIKIAAVGSARWNVSKACSQGVHKRVSECWMMSKLMGRFRLEQA